MAAAGAHEEAAREFERAIHEGMDLQDVRIDYARNLEAIGRLDDAAEQYRQLVASWRRAIDRNPGQAQERFTREGLAEAEEGLRAVLVRKGRAAESPDP